MIKKLSAICKFSLYALNRIKGPVFTIFLMSGLLLLTFKSPE